MIADWHSDSERRREAGEAPVPVPLPHKLATSTPDATAKKIKAIEVRVALNGAMPHEHDGATRPMYMHAHPLLICNDMDCTDLLLFG